MQLSEEFRAKWEHIINDVDMTEVPLECIEKVIVKLHQNRRRTINLKKLRQQGLNYDEIEQVMSRTLHELDSEVRDLEFRVDVGAVAEIVQHETDKILAKL